MKRMLASGLAALGLAALAIGSVQPAMAQACSREGDAVTCLDGRHGVLQGDVIVWPDGRARLGA